MNYIRHNVFLLLCFLTCPFNFARTGHDHSGHLFPNHKDTILSKIGSNGEAAFYVENPSDIGYPMWTAQKPIVGQAWPQVAKQQRNGAQLIVLSKLDLKFKVSKHTSDYDDVVDFNLARYKRIMQHCTLFEDVSDHKLINGNPTVHIIMRNENDTGSYPTADMDESYEISATAEEIVIKAKSKWAVVRSLETLSQLIFCSKEHEASLLLPTVNIEDWPRFRHRGLLIDTARHFITKEILLENLDAMSYNKLNIFHWHMVDDHSFPFQSKVFPNAWQHSAFSGGAYHYTYEDIHEIVEFARLRGIRVIPEFDSPDHTHALSHAYPHLAVWCKVNGKWFLGPLNPILKDTYTAMYKLLSEIKNLFPDKFVHLGMDEVSTSCWQANETLVSYMKQHNLKIQDLIAMYGKNMIRIAKTLNMQPIMWEDITDHMNLPDGSFIQWWLSSEYDQKLQKWKQRNYKLIASKNWYLDRHNYGADWVNRYLWDPGQVYGGEACMWTEFVDSDTIMYTIWPTTSAIAERLWSQANIRDHNEAGPRFEAQRCRMKGRGIRTGVGSGPGMCHDVKEESMKRYFSFGFDMNSISFSTHSPLNTKIQLCIFLLSCILIITFVEQKYGRRIVNNKYVYITIKTIFAINKRSLCLYTLLLLSLACLCIFYL